MANHVDNIIEVFFNKEDQNAIDFLTQLYEIGTDGDLSSLYENAENTRSWWGDNIGAKWAYVNDLDTPPEEGFFYINITSAWSPVIPLVEYISESLNHKCRIEHRYIDEMPNFAGCRIIKDGEIVYDVSDEDMWTTLEEEKELRMKSEDLHFDNEEEEEQWFWDWRWEYVHEFVDPDNFKE
jgi:hypothetical protein